jgi:hypothetical protein
MALIDGEYYYRPPAKKTVAKKALYYPKTEKIEYTAPQPPKRQGANPTTQAAPIKPRYQIVDQYLLNRGYGTTPATQQTYKPPAPAPVKYGVNGLPSYAVAPAYDQYAANRGYTVPLYNKPVAATSVSPVKKWGMETNWGWGDQEKPAWVKLVGSSWNEFVKSGKDFVNYYNKTVTAPARQFRESLADIPNAIATRNEYKPNASQYKSFYEQQTNKYGTFGWVPPYTSNEMAQRYNPQWANSDQGNALRYLTDQLGLNIPLSAMGAPNSAGGMGAPYYDPIVPPYNSTTRTVPGNQTRLPNSPAATYPTQRPVSTQANVTRLPGSPASPWASSLYNVTRLPGTSATNAVQTKTPYQLPQWHPYQYRGEFDPYEMGGSPYQITDPFNFAPMTMDELLASGADPWAHDPYDPAGSPYMTSNLESTAGWDGSSGGGYGWGGWGDGGWGGGGGGGSYGASSGVSSYLPGAGGGYGARASAPNYTGRGAGRGSSYAGSESYNTPQWRMPMLVWNI